MKLSKHIVDLTDKMIRNELDEPELSQFLAELEKNNGLKEQVDQLDIIKKGISYAGLSQLLDKTEVWEKEIIEEESNKKRSKNYKSKAAFYLWSAISSIAAGFVLVAFVLVQQKKEELQHIERHFVHQKSDVSSKRSSDVIEISPLRERAFNLYNIREYKEAAKNLEQVFKEEGDWNSLLYAGIANLGHGKIEKAEEQLSLYLTNNPDDDIAQRYLSLITRIKKESDT